jgi:hypothetical protein
MPNLFRYLIIHSRSASTPLQFPTLFTACRREGRPAKQRRVQRTPWEVSQPSLHPRQCITANASLPCFIRPAVERANIKYVIGNLFRHLIIQSRPASTPVQFFNPLSDLPERGWPSEAKAGPKDSLGGESTLPASTPMHYRQCHFSIPDTTGRRKSQYKIYHAVRRLADRHLIIHSHPAFTPVQFFNPLSGLPERGWPSKAKAGPEDSLGGESTLPASTQCLPYSKSCWQLLQRQFFAALKGLTRLTMESSTGHSPFSFSWVILLTLVDAQNGQIT